MSGIKRSNAAGFTLVELVIGLTVVGIIGLGIFGLYLALVNSAVVAQQKAHASTLATNQMEYLKSLPYNNLAVAGGSIYSTSPLPASSTQKLNGVTYTIKTSINYVDDAYDGCAAYPTQELKQKYCRNYPAPSGAPATDQNPQDYKVIHVSVYNKGNLRLAEVDTQIAARVAETASTTGAVFVNVIDSDGNPVEGATVQVANMTITPAANVSDATDSNGIAIFYGLPPDTTSYDYVVTASKTGYSSLTTIAPTGTLQPTYPSLRVFTQASSYVTLTIAPQATNSLAIETTTTNGTALGGVRVYAKGGYKKYTATTDTSYYYDNLSPTDNRILTDGNGLASLTNLVPGNYIFCGDTGATSCSVGGTTYYLAAAVPYGGGNALSPITVAPYDAASPPSFTQGGLNYVQKVRLLLTTSSTHPRITTFTPSELSLTSGNLSAVNFQVTGANLPCNASAASCTTTVRFTKDAQTYTASCTGSSAGTQLNCTVNLSAITAGDAQLSVSANGYTLDLPVSPLLGGLRVTP